MVKILEYYYLLLPSRHVTNNSIDTLLIIILHQLHPHSAHIDILFFNSAILFAVPHDESSMVAHHKQLGGRKSHCNLLGWGVVRVRVIMPIIAVLQFVQFRHLFSMMNSKQHITPLPSVALLQQIRMMQELCIRR